MVFYDLGWYVGSFEIHFLSLVMVFKTKHVVDFPSVVGFALQFVCLFGKYGNMNIFDIHDISAEVGLHLFKH